MHLDISTASEFDLRLLEAVVGNFQQQIAAVISSVLFLLVVLLPINI